MPAAQFDQFARPAGIEQHAVQIGAVHDRVRITEARLEIVAERNRCDRLPVDRVHQPQAVYIDRAGTRLVADTERVETMECIGTDLDAGADFAKFGGTLEYHRSDSLARQTERRGEAADTAAGDDYGQAVGAGTRHGDGGEIISIMSIMPGSGSVNSTHLMLDRFRVIEQ